MSGDLEVAGKFRSSKVAIPKRWNGEKKVRNEQREEGLRLLEGNWTRSINLNMNLSQTPFLSSLWKSLCTKFTAYFPVVDHHNIVNSV